MKIVVLNGSPKGETSVTMQYIRFIQKKFPQHQLEMIHISQTIHRLEKDEQAFQDVIEKVRNSDGVLWAFPLYVCLVHSNYKRFIELIGERSTGNAFSGKYTAAFSTSIHYYDHTAHNYIHAICDDLNMKYLGYFSADMDDLLNPEKQRQIDLFAADFFAAIEKKAPTFKCYLPVVYQEKSYFSGDSGRKIDNRDQKVLIIADTCRETSNLGRMVGKTKSLFSGTVEVVDLETAQISGGCLGCCQCGLENQCVYRDSDDIQRIYNVLIRQADIVIFAGRIVDRYFSARWKMFTDRRFLNTHQPILTGKQVGYIVSGPLSQNHNLRELIQAEAEFDQSNLVAIVTDEAQNSAEIDSLLENMAERLVWSAAQKCARPATFLGVSALKLFRDDIWGRMRFPFIGDYKYFKRHKMYDFPQRQIKTRIINGLMILLCKVPPVREEIKKRIKEEMVKPYGKVVG